MEGAYFVPKTHDSQHAVETAPARYVSAHTECEASESVMFQTCQVLSVSVNAETRPLRVSWLSLPLPSGSLL